MIGSSINTICLKNFSQFLNLLPAQTINNTRFLRIVLDKFDNIVNNISKGLPKEIELRQKQYEYYREKLLSFER